MNETTGVNLNMVSKACLFLLVIFLTILQSNAGANRCGIPIHKRVECGTDLKNEADCQRESCCWIPCSDCPPHIPWCVMHGDTMRLAGRYGTRGRLDVFHSNKWGMVCSTNFGQNEAKAACRHLGYTDMSQVRFNKRWTRRYGPQMDLLPTIWLDNLQCPEGAASFVTCSHDPIGEHSCRPEEAVYVTCSNRRRASISCSIPRKKKHKEPRPRV